MQRSSLRAATVAFALALVLGAAASAAPARNMDDPKTLYQAVVDMRIRAMPFLLGSNAFVRDYGRLLLCTGNLSESGSRSRVRGWRETIVQRLANQESRFVTATFRSPLLDYDAQQRGFPFPLIISDDQHESIFSASTGDIEYNVPWRACGPPDWQSTVLPKSATVFAANSGILSVIAAPPTRANALLRAMGGIPSVTITAKLRLETVDLATDSAPALIESYAAYAGNDLATLVGKWPTATDRDVMPLTCEVQNVWITPASGVPDSTPFAHVRVVLRAHHLVSVRPDQFVLTVPYANGGLEEISGADSQSPPAFDGSVLALLTRQSGAEVKTRSTVEPDEDLGLSLATLLAPGRGASYDWVVSFPMLPYVGYAGQAISVVWDYAVDHPCRPQSSSALTFTGTGP